jgi:tellurite methyltransferase
MRFKERFNQKYKNTPGVFGRPPMPILKKALEIVPDGKALDLGVGNGRNALYLLEKGFKVTGVDMSEEGIKLLKQRVPDDAEIKLVVEDVTKFETEEKFDLVCAVGLLHFLEVEKIKKLVQKMKNFTNPSGVNVIGAKMTQNFVGDLPHVFKHNELKEMYQEEGWEIYWYKELSRPRGKVATIIAKKNVSGITNV